MMAPISQDMRMLCSLPSTIGQTVSTGATSSNYISVADSDPVFGFPSSPELPAKGHNLGFLDQRLALDWVQRNIHEFGGAMSFSMLIAASH